MACGRFTRARYQLSESIITMTSAEFVGVLGVSSAAGLTAWKAAGLLASEATSGSVSVMDFSQFGFAAVAFIACGYLFISYVWDRTKKLEDENRRLNDLLEKKNEQLIEASRGDETLKQ